MYENTKQQDLYCLNTEYHRIYHCLTQILFWGDMSGVGGPSGSLMRGTACASLPRLLPSPNPPTLLQTEATTQNASKVNQKAENAEHFAEF